MESTVQPALRKSLGSRVRLIMDRYFYFLMSWLIALIVLYGFSRTVGDKLLHPLIPRPSILYWHAVVFSAWILFFVVQSALVRTGRVAWHRITGYAGAVLGGLVFVIGIWTAIAMARFNAAHVRFLYAALSLLISLYDISAFAVPFALAIVWRKRPELHRRLLLISMCALTAAAFGRFPIPAGVRALIVFYVPVDLLLMAGIARDWIVLKRPHPVYFYALTAFALCQSTVAHAVYHHSASWLRAAHALID
jgi:hypothetical protein